LIAEAAKIAGLQVVFTSEETGPVEIIIKENTHIKNPVEKLKKAIREVHNRLGSDEQTKFKQYKLKVHYLEDTQEFTVLSCFIRVTSPN
jgi:hypothetical protein